MKSFSVTTKIASSPEKIWSVLTDPTSYPEWAAGVHRLEGKIENGAVLKLFTVSKPQNELLSGSWLFEALKMVQC